MGECEHLVKAGQCRLLTHMGQRDCLLADDWEPCSVRELAARAVAAEEDAERLAEVDRDVVRTVQEILLLLGRNDKAMKEHAGEAVLYLSPSLCQDLTKAITAWEDALKAHDALREKT